MASLLTHPIVPVAAAALVGRKAVALPLVWVWAPLLLLALLGYFVRMPLAVR